MRINEQKKVISEKISKLTKEILEYDFKDEQKLKMITLQHEELIAKRENIERIQTLISNICLN